VCNLPLEKVLLHKNTKKKFFLVFLLSVESFLEADSNEI
jgi:hypothetical protein